MTVPIDLRQTEAVAPTATTLRRSISRLLALTLGAAISVWFGVSGTENAEANGDTRTLTILHEHTKESATITFKRNGSYDADALKELNWLLRDWRIDEAIRMEPRLFDIVWEVYREVGSQEPIHVVSAYRSPGTNAMLRRRSKAVAEHSQHMLGHAMDFFLPDVPMSRVREVGMRLQEGGVGFYPNAFNPFVHLDAGGVRSWPRMGYDQLARLFPDGRTVHMPRSGGPLAGYEVAKAEILAKGGTVAGETYAEAEDTSPRKSLWAMLFGGSGGGDDEDTAFYAAQRGGRSASGPPVKVASAAPLNSAAAGNSEDGGSRGLPMAGTSGVAAAAPANVPARLGQQVAAANPVPPPAAAPASATVAPDPLSPEPAAQEIGLLATAPMPPRRPDEFAALLAAPLPPARPIELAALVGSAPARSAKLDGHMSISEPARLVGPPGGEDRSGLQALFDAAAIGRAALRVAEGAAAHSRPGAGATIALFADARVAVRTEFTSVTLDAPPADANAFTGAAVSPIPLLP